MSYNIKQVLELVLIALIGLPIALFVGGILQGTFGATTTAYNGINLIMNGVNNAISLIWQPVIEIAFLGIMIGIIVASGLLSKLTTGFGKGE